MSVATITTLTDRAPKPAGLVWEEPPARSGEGRYAEISAALRARPGQWAVIRTYQGEQKKRGWSFASHVNSGKLIDFPADGFEACARTVDGQVRVYVRAVAR